MHFGTPASYEEEHDLVRRQVINQILHEDRGLRRGLNHDLPSDVNDEYALIRYFLARDRYFQLMERRGLRCPDAAHKALMRRQVIEDAITDLIDNGDLYHLSGFWSLKVSATDDHRNVGRHRRKQSVAFNDGSYHGRPRRDRNRQLQHVA